MHTITQPLILKYIPKNAFKIHKLSVWKNPEFGMHHKKLIPNFGVVEGGFENGRLFKCGG